MSGGTNQSALTDSLEALLQSIWNDETYRPFYDEAYCLNQNVTYSNRVDAESEQAGGAGVVAGGTDSAWGSCCRAAASSSTLSCAL
jgi:hypothetical protein